MAALAPTKVIGLVALGDLVSGIVLTVLGVVGDIQMLSIIGVVLLLSGAGAMAWVVWWRNRPQLL